ncbi:hypothetical protein HMPREF0973_01161 [Prevotella veroralis F0319]|uniref:Uncharacterized protein n=1 Tax=Prevotella veroralis F0319 TaxID=649761 RepID=C9MNH4_9BACT|nr:hypothetical protein HMPREF0973_01161 [Prevotella veroralis F0319]
MLTSGKITDPPPSLQMRGKVERAFYIQRGRFLISRRAFLRVEETPFLH